MPFGVLSLSQQLCPAALLIMSTGPLASRAVPQEFLLSPHQLGIPYFRSRYFALASKQPFRHARYSGQLIRHPPVLLPGEVRLALSSTLLPSSVTERLLQLCSSQGDTTQTEGRQEQEQQQPTPAGVPGWPPPSFSGKADIRPITQACLPLGHFLEHGAPVDEASRRLWQDYTIAPPVLAKFWKSYGE